MSQNALSLLVSQSRLYGCDSTPSPSVLFRLLRLIESFSIIRLSSTASFPFFRTPLPPPLFSSALGVRRPVRPPKPLSQRLTGRTGARSAACTHALSTCRLRAVYSLQARPWQKQHGQTNVAFSFSFSLLPFFSPRGSRRGCSPQVPSKLPWRRWGRGALWRPWRRGWACSSASPQRPVQRCAAPLCRVLACRNRPDEPLRATDRAMRQSGRLHPFSCPEINGGCLLAPMLGSQPPKHSHPMILGACVRSAPRFH